MVRYITTILVNMCVGIFHLVTDPIFLFDILIVRITMDTTTVILTAVTIVLLEEGFLCVRTVFEERVWSIGFSWVDGRLIIRRFVPNMSNPEIIKAIPVLITRKCNQMLGWLCRNTGRIQCFQAKLSMSLVVWPDGNELLCSGNPRALPILPSGRAGRSGILITEAGFLSILVLMLAKGGDLAL